MRGPITVRDVANWLGAESVEAVSLRAAMRAHVLAVLNASGGNISLAARALGVNRRVLQRKLAAYNGKQHARRNKVAAYTRTAEHARRRRRRPSAVVAIARIVQMAPSAPAALQAELHRRVFS
jgi:transcriptional regulator with GAF, ATPase, and Fis domain